ncbi:tripartite tricarboxylate transporter substrate binding protein [Microbacteriaceae bacterium K1510]|nr:tripartite tricarboxylate transporter substrate binding protein [Microbacteriaceae bacterium K1510]
MDRRAFLSFAALAAGYGLTSAAAQTTFPNGPIRLVVPYPPGGVVDVVARNWAEAMRRYGTVVVENISGGGGTIGAGNIARSRADGQSILFGETGCLIISPSLLKPAPYDPIADFAPVSMLFSADNLIVVDPNLPVKTLAEFISYAKSPQNKVSYASAGIGTSTHLAGELFKQLTGASNIVHVPYRGAGPALVDVMAGIVPMCTPNVTTQILDYHRAGKLRILAVCSASRLKIAPEIPAATETLPGMIMRIVGGIVVPAKTPDTIVSQLAKMNETAVKDERLVMSLNNAGLELRTDLSAATARAFLKEESDRLLPIMKVAGIQLQ